MTPSVSLILGIILLAAGAEGLIHGAVTIGRRAGLSPLLVGMAIVGFGTSLPELVVSVQATASGQPDLAVGNVFGSNIANILLILAIGALAAPLARPVRVFLPDGAVLLAVTAGVAALGLQGIIPAWQGALLVALLIGLTAAEYRRGRGNTALEAALLEEKPVAPAPHSLWFAVALVLVGIPVLVMGADLLVDGATAIAEALGVPAGVVGLTFVALGTSLPELASVLAAARRGEGGVLYGSIVGSNLFNLLGILGVSAMAGPLAVPEAMVWLDGGAMLAATLVMLVFLATGRGLNRVEALVLLDIYALYFLARYAYVWLQ